MKNLLLFTLLIGLTFNLSAQDTDATDDYNKWQVRLRLISVIPNESADIEAIGGDVEISTAFVPELDFTYFFSKHHLSGPNKNIDKVIKLNPISLIATSL